MSTTAVSLPQLNTVNFFNWKYRIEMFLDKEGVRKCLTLTDNEKTQCTENESEMKTIQDPLVDKVNEENKNNDYEKDKTEIGNTRTRQVKRSSKYDDYELYTAYCFCVGDPTNYEEAVTMGSGWEKAIRNEIKAHEYHGTWIPAIMPPDKKPIDTRWVFKTKQDGTKKARLVAKGYQEECTYNVYAPVARTATIRMLISHALQNRWPIRQMDIPTAFLNGDLDSDIYINIPVGIKVKNGNVLKLRKALYGLKESPRKWNECFDSFTKENGLTRSQNDFCLYTSDNALLLIWVDDLLITGRDCAKLIRALKERFKAKDMGELKYFLGTQVIRKEDEIYISQKNFIEKILIKFNMLECKEVSTPMEVNFQIDKDSKAVDVTYRELVGSLLYLATISRPGITYATSF